jgi:hypothetical protein
MHVKPMPVHLYQHSSHRTGKSDHGSNFFKLGLSSGTQKLVSDMASCESFPLTSADEAVSHHNTGTRGRISDRL